MGKTSLDTTKAMNAVTNLINSLEYLDSITKKLNLSDKDIVPKELVLYDGEFAGIRHDRSTIYFYNELKEKNDKLTNTCQNIEKYIKALVSADNTKKPRASSDPPGLPDIAPSQTPTEETPVAELTPTEVPTPVVEPVAEIKETPVAPVTVVDQPTTSVDVGASIGNKSERFETGKFVITDGNATVIDENGNVIKSVGKGEYKVYEVRVDENGNPVAVRISPDGEAEEWIMLNQNGKHVGSFIDEGQVGIYDFSNDTVNVYDANGNLIGTISNGRYRVYGVKYNDAGQLAMVKITSSGEEELWLQVCDDAGVCVGTYTPNVTVYEETVSLKDGKSSVNFFNKKTLIAGAAIGVLSIATIGVAHKIKKNKENQYTDDYETYDENETENVETAATNNEEVAPGEYDIYGVNYDEDNNIKEAYVKEKNDNPENGQDNNGYWLEF